MQRTHHHLRQRKNAAPPLFIQDNELVPVGSAKILGIHLSADLKSGTRLHGSQGVKAMDLHSALITVYITCLRPVLEYGCQVWHYGGTNYLCEEVERIQERALRIIFPNHSYKEALSLSGLPLLNQRRDVLCRSYFKKTLYSNHNLNVLIPQKRGHLHCYSHKNDRNIDLFPCKTSRFRESFIPSSVMVFNNL